MEMKTNQPTNGAGAVGGPSAQAALTWRRPSVAAVTQRELGLYLDLSKQARRHRALRAELLARLDAEALVESGPLSACIEHFARRALSVKALTPLLGEDRVRQLQEAVGPTVCRHLVILGV
jgi:hypothetical protein